MADASLALAERRPDDLKQAVERRSANLSRGEHDIGPTRGLHAAPRYFQDLSIRVDADNLPGWAN